MDFYAAEQTNPPPPETSKIITSLFDTEGLGTNGESEFNQNFACMTATKSGKRSALQQQQQQPSPQQEQQQNDTIGGNVGGRAMLDDDFWTQPVAPASVVAASAPINMPAMPGMPQMPGLGIPAAAERSSSLPPSTAAADSSSSSFYSTAAATTTTTSGSFCYVWQHDWCLGAPPPKQSAVQPVTAMLFQPCHRGHANDNSKSFFFSSSSSAAATRTTKTSGSFCYVW